MAKIIVEDRTFKDRDSGISTDYKYYAIAGEVGGNKYEVQLKNLVGAEKTALEMLAMAENVGGEVVSRKSTTDEGVGVGRKTTILDDDDEDEKGGGLFK